jgi:hypothetical protein
MGDGMIASWVSQNEHLLIISTHSFEPTSLSAFRWGAFSRRDGLSSLANVFTQTDAGQSKKIQ